MGVPLFILAVLCIAGGLLDLPRTLGGAPLLTKFLETALPAAAGETPPSTDAILQLISEALSHPGHPRGLADLPPGSSSPVRSRRGARRS